MPSRNTLLLPKVNRACDASLQMTESEAPTLNCVVAVIVVPVIAANRVGNEAGQIFYGSSFIANHRGEKVAELNRTEEGVITAVIDLDEVRRARAAFGFFRDRRPEHYGALVTVDGKR
jgi:predicted amidohydrolase